MDYACRKRSSKPFAESGILFSQLLRQSNHDAQHHGVYNKIPPDKNGRNAASFQSHKVVIAS